MARHTWPILCLHLNLKVTFITNAIDSFSIWVSVKGASFALILRVQDLNISLAIRVQTLFTFLIRVEIRWASLTSTIQKYNFSVYFAFISKTNMVEFIRPSVIVTSLTSSRLQNDLGIDITIVSNTLVLVRFRIRVSIIGTVLALIWAFFSNLLWSVTAGIQAGFLVLVWIKVGFTF